MFGELKRPALGQIAPLGLGSLYDARSDSFTSVSLLAKNPAKTPIVVTETHSSDLKISRSDTYKEKFKHLGMDSGLGASFLAGMVDVGGSGKYLKEKAKSSIYMQASLLYNITTVHEALNLHDVKDSLAFEELEGSLGTHFVTGITWGAQCIVTAKCEASHEESWNEMAGQLKAELSKFKSVGAGGNASFQVEKEKHTFQSSFQVTVHGDVLPDSGLVPTDFEGVYQFLSNVPKYITKANNGKGMPILYTLMSLEIVPFLCQMPIRAHVTLTQLSFECLEKFVQLFDDLQAAKQKLTDYYNRIQNHHRCIPPAHVRATTDQLRSINSTEGNLKSEYAACLKDVRGGIADSQQLWVLYGRFSAEDNAPGMLATIEYTYNQKMEFVDTIEREGARYIGYGDSLNLEVVQTVTDDVYVMYFSDELRNTSEWDANVALIMDILRDKSKDKAVFVVDCEATQESLDKVRIRHRLRNQWITEDLLEHERMQDYCIMRYSQSKLDRSSTYKPIGRRAVKISCPSTYCQPSPPCIWVCFRCRSPVEYGHVDEYLYCDCGRCLYEHWEFKCNGRMHDLNFEKYDSKKLIHQLSQLEPFEELNILILGETGVGKSTWINAFVNYLTFESLDQAIEADDLKHGTDSIFNFFNTFRCSRGC